MKIIKVFEINTAALKGDFILIEFMTFNFFKISPIKLLVGTIASMLPYKLFQEHTQYSNKESLRKLHQHVLQKANQTAEFVEDKFSPARKYISINKTFFDENNVILKVILQRAFGQAPVIAKFGHDSMLKYQENELLIFRNTEPEIIRNAFFYDTTNYTHRIAFRTAEFHTYIKVTEKASNESIFYSGAPEQRGAQVGKLYIRNDSYYEKKYFKGYQKLIPGEISPTHDQGSLSIEFDISAEQASMIHKYLAELHNELKKLPSDIDNYHFFPLRDNTTNCAELAQGIFSHIGFKGNFYSYAKIDETDLRDKGIFYLFYSNSGFYNAVLKNFNIAFSSYFQKTLYEYLYYKLPFYLNPYFYNGLLDKIVSYANNHSNENIENINAQNIYGDTLLHEALIKEDIPYATALLSKGADVNILNNKMENALFLAAALSASEEKFELIKQILPLSSNVNQPNYNNIAIPLTMAAKANDEKSVQFLLKNGANGSFINSNGDSILDIALNYHKAFNISDEFHFADPQLIYRQNLEFHPPAYIITENVRYFELDFINLINQERIIPLKDKMSRATFDETMSGVSIEPFLTAIEPSDKNLTCNFSDDDRSILSSAFYNSNAVCEC